MILAQELANTTVVFQYKIVLHIAYIFHDEVIFVISEIVSLEAFIPTFCDKEKTFVDALLWASLICLGG